MHNFTCSGCGAPFTHALASAKYCTPVCKGRAKSRRKYHANKAEHNRKSAEYKRRTRTWKQTFTECVGCGSELDAPHWAPKYCTDECRSEAKKRQRSSWASSALRNQHNSHKRRAIAYGVPYEHFDKHEVYERDNWTCRLCGEPIEQATRWPDPLSPSLDHIIPMSKGGPHLKGNTQASHLVCNLSKYTTLHPEGAVESLAG